MDKANTTRGDDNTGDPWARSVGRLFSLWSGAARVGLLARVGRAFLRRFGTAFLVHFLVMQAVLSLTLLFFSITFHHFVQRPRVQMFVGHLVTQLGALGASVQAMPEEMRGPYLESLGRLSEGRMVAEDPYQWDLSEPDPTLLQDAFDIMRARLPSYTIAMSHEPRRVLWFAFPLEGGRMQWIRMDAPSFVVVPAGPTLLAAVIITIMAAAGAAFLMARLRRRLSWLPHALDGLDARNGAVSSLPLTEQGTDLLELDRHFTDMAARLANAHAERGLMMKGISGDLRGLLQRLRQAQPRASMPPEAMRCIDDMERVVAQFSDYSRANTEPIRALDVNQLLTELVLQASTGEVPITMELGGLPYTDLRPSAARRIFGNLLDNALRHGGHPIEVISSLENGWVVVRVLDCGAGVSDDELALLGRPFYRTEAARARGPGSGLGLAIVRQEAEAHGGALRLVRRPEGGMQAEVWLPPARLS